MNLKLQAKNREVGKVANVKLRKQDLLPAVLYGHGIKNQNLALNKAEFEKISQQAGASGIIDVVLSGHSPVKALIQDVARHPTSGKILHVDLYQIRMDEKITHDVVLNFTGESKAVKELSGILVKNLSMVPVKCLPADLPAEISVDISKLVDFESKITIADLAIPKGVELLAKPEEVVVLVEPPRSEEELKALDEKVEEKVEEVAKIEKEKPVEEEGEAEAVATPPTPAKTEKNKS
ncbi:50S ribosomal protein L25 [Candidatus Parcubacteria bacterium]|jgi:large subunit ribosomal protein L25|nr:MAG: 50S ribosomal protein L25 [Candidatus Parcubacteria bacterium]